MTTRSAALWRERPLRLLGAQRQTVVCLYPLRQIRRSDSSPIAAAVWLGIVLAWATIYLAAPKLIRIPPRVAQAAESHRPPVTD
jgi:hypothetical protein